jgi:hypothetical protein
MKSASVEVADFDFDAIVDGRAACRRAPETRHPAYDVWQAERAKEAARPKGTDAAR